MSQPKTVLIIDDDQEIRGAVEIVLQQKGYRVITAGDGNAGLARAERENPDLVIVDMMMPKKSGFLVLEYLKQRGQDCPPVIMITGNEGIRHRAYAESLGVDGYLRKPFAMDDMLDHVRNLCPSTDGDADDTVI